jgi:DNA repair protein RadC
MKITDLPKHERPREKMIERGPSGLKDKELLAILLRTGYTGKNVIEVAEEILRKFPMKKLLAFTYDEMVKIKGIDSGKACSLLAAFELTKRAMDVEDNNLPFINTAKEAVAQLQELRTAKKEYFVALYLNARNQLIHKETISVGTLNASLVHPREVFKPAIDCLAASIIVAHNHPSGGCEPSEADVMLTGRLADAGKLLGVEVADHLVVTGDDFKSIL